MIVYAYYTSGVETEAALGPVEVAPLLLGDKRGD